MEAKIVGGSDVELQALWHSRRVGTWTPASETLLLMEEYSQTCLGLTSAQAGVFVISHVLMLSVTRNEYSHQPNVILSGPPGGGKSEVLNNVANCLPGSMVRHVDAKSRCVDLVAVSEDDMIFKLQDELDLSSSAPADKAKQGEANAKLARGWIISSRCLIDETTKKLIRYNTIVSAREYSFGCTNDAMATGRSALADRSLMIFFGTRGEEKTGPSMVARKSTKLAQAKRPVFETMMKYLHVVAVAYWSIEAAGGIVINTEAGSILQSINAVKGAPGSGRSREYGYEERIATNLMVLEVLTVWHRHQFGKKYGYALETFIYFARCHSTVKVHHYVIAAALVRNATLMDGEESDVVGGLKMMAVVPITLDGPYIVLQCRPVTAARSIAPHTLKLGEGVRQEVINALYRKLDGGMPVLDEHDTVGGPPRVKLLVDAAVKVLTPPQKIIIAELARLMRDEGNTKRWHYKYEEDGTRRSVVFKASVREAVMTPAARIGVYSPPSIIALPPHVHSLSIALLSLKGWEVCDTPVPCVIDGKRGFLQNNPLVVECGIFRLLDAVSAGISTVGLAYGGGVEPGTMLYTGVGSTPVTVPALATDVVNIDNPYFVKEEDRRESVSTEMEDEMEQWVVDREPIVEPVTVTQAIASPLFPPMSPSVDLAPGFEADVVKSHQRHTNGRAAPASWAQLETITS
jgi:hypothetical protein